MVSLREFENPPSKCRIKPFWFWNSLLQEGELLEQIEDMHEHGVGGFFIHARFGLETEYLSTEWLDLVKKCVEKASELSMEVWIYDENPFPSGIGGLKVSSQRRYRNRYVECIEQPLASGQNRFQVGDGSVLGVRCLGAEASASGDPLPLPYDADSDGGLVIEYSGHEPACAAVYVERVLESLSGKHFGIDYLNPEAVAAFIEVTHERYREHLGEYFGETIKGFFADEPTLLPWHQDLDWYVARGDGRVVAWSDEISRGLSEKHGYSLDEVLDALFFGGGERASSIRRDFWTLVSRVYERSFFAAYEDWCHRYGLEFTGHVLLEEGLYFNTIFQGNAMRILEHMDMPGTDHLTRTAEQLGIEFMVGTAPHLPKVRTNVQGQKLVASSAHLSGKTPVITESFGIGGWGLTLQDMKWITDWQYSLGINRLCPHAFFYSIEGFRKLDAPPCHMHNLSWRYFRYFADYVARTSYLLSQGRHRADVAVLYPLGEFQASYVPGVQGEDDRRISDSFDLACSSLPRLHYDYDVMGEHHLLDAKVSDGLLHLHGESFKLLIVPTLGRLSCDHLRRIREFSQSGGVVLFLTTSDGVARISEEWGCLKGASYRWLDTSNLERDDDVSAFRRDLAVLLASCLTPDVTIDGDDCDRIYYHHRSAEDEDMYFFANTSDKVAVQAHISVGSAGAVAVYDCETGGISSLAGYSVREGRTEFDHSFEPGSSLAVGVRRGGTFELPEVFAAKGRPQVIETLPVDEWSFALNSPNALPLADWSFSIRSGGMGTSYRYETSLGIGEGVRDLKLMLDDIENREAFMGSTGVQVRVNGKGARGPTGYHVDKKFRTWDIGHLVVEGSNSIEIILNHAAWSGAPRALVSTPVLLGWFRVRDSQQELSIEKPDQTLGLGFWTDKGYPFLSGTATYSNEFTLNQLYPHLTLQIGQIHEYLEVFINGAHAGDLIWRPWMLDISSHVKQGTNRIALRVTNTLSNMLERTPKPAGILGPITIVGQR